MKNNTYFYAQEADLFTFYRIPKELVKNTKFKKMNGDSKLLYGLLLDRNSLSIKNNWVDEQNRVFVYYSREDVQEDLNVGNQKAGKLFAELKEYGLIEEVRQGLHKPNKIYVKKFMEQPSTPDNTRTCENHISEDVKITSQEVGKSHANYTENNNTENNNEFTKVNSCESRAEEDLKITTEIIEKYNEVCSELPSVRDITQSRVNKTMKVYRQLEKLKYNPPDKVFKAVFLKMRMSKFMNGLGKSKWRANYDWLFDEEDRIIRILEGQYDDELCEDGDIGRAILDREV